MESSFLLLLLFFSPLPSGAETHAAIHGARGREGTNEVEASQLARDAADDDEEGSQHRRKFEIQNLGKCAALAYVVHHHGQGGSRAGCFQIVMDSMGKGGWEGNVSLSGKCVKRCRSWLSPGINRGRRASH